jgi:hypothetical protein
MSYTNSGALRRGRPRACGCRLPVTQRFCRNRVALLCLSPWHAAVGHYPTAFRGFCLLPATPARTSVKPCEVRSGESNRQNAGTAVTMRCDFVMRRAAAN